MVGNNSYCLVHRRNTRECNLMICGRCGEDVAYRLPPDYIDYCPDCGVIEGLDNVEVDENA